MVAATPFLLLVSALSAVLHVPINRPVVDRAKVLSPAGVEQVAASVRQLRKSTDAQMAVVLIDSTEGEAIEDLAHRLATTWAGGRRGRNNGLLLLVAIKDAKMRLEVGTGLTQTFPDAVAKTLLDGMKPSLRAREYATAVTDLIAAVEKRISSPESEERVQVTAPPPPPKAEPAPEPTPAAPPAAALSTPFPEDSFDRDFNIYFPVAFAVVLFIILGSWVRELFGETRASSPLYAGRHVLSALILAVAIVALKTFKSPAWIRFFVMAAFGFWSTMHAELMLVGKRAASGKDLSSARASSRLYIRIAATAVAVVGMLLGPLLWAAVLTAVAVVLQVALGALLRRQPMSEIDIESGSRGSIQSSSYVASSDADSSSFVSNDTDTSTSYASSSTGSSDFGSSSTGSSDFGSSSTGSSTGSSSTTDSNSTDNSGGGGSFSGGGASSSW